ncbi:MAG: lytic transglycosylase domain-containing protein [Acutalibacter sp.]|jgi:soluble lytic murein transglycosylase
MKKGCVTCLILAVLLIVVGVLFGPKLWERALQLLYPQGYAQLVEKEAEEFQLDPDLVFAVIKTESGFDPEAKSHADAMGLMQLTQETFDWIVTLYPLEDPAAGVYDPQANIHCGCALLRLLLDQYGSVDVALAAYNAGMGNVSQWLDSREYSHDGATLHTIPYPETDAYVKKVRRAYGMYQKLYPD